MEELAKSLANELRDLFPKCDVLVELINRTMMMVQVYQGSWQGPWAGYATIFLGESEFDLRFSHMPGIDFFEYTDPTTMERLVEKLKAGLQWNKLNYADDTCVFVGINENWRVRQ